MGWRDAAYAAARPLLFAADAEAVHRLTLRALSLAGGNAPGRWLARLASGAPRAGDPGTAVDLGGLRFRNRVGVAAGFDKDAVALRGWGALGLGFVEVGTITPIAQAGNLRPRLFRLSTDRALINRMGFNNAGAESVAGNIATARQHLPEGFVVGVNISRNAATQAEDVVHDYVEAARVVADVADYLAINVSSPNTPGLRDLQEPGRLTTLLAAIDGVQPRRPLLVKLAPDLDPAAFDVLVHALADTPARGLILSNTSVGRPALRSSPALVAQDGGLSGPPLLPTMLAAVEHARSLTGDRFAIIASGGIASRADAERALAAGADLVQLWTGLVYRGPGLIGEIIGAEP